MVIKVVIWQKSKIRWPRAFSLGRMRSSSSNLPPTLYRSGPEMMPPVTPRCSEKDSWGRNSKIIQQVNKHVLTKTWKWVIENKNTLYITTCIWTKNYKCDTRIFHFMPTTELPTCHFQKTYYSAWKTIFLGEKTYFACFTFFPYKMLLQSCFFWIKTLSIIESCRPVTWKKKKKKKKKINEKKKLIQKKKMIW